MYAKHGTASAKVAKVQKCTSTQILVPRACYQLLAADNAFLHKLHFLMQFLTECMSTRLDQQCQLHCEHRCSLTCPIKLPVIVT